MLILPFPPWVPAMSFRTRLATPILLSVTVVTALLPNPRSFAADVPPATREVLQKYCGDCHDNGAEEGGLALNQLLGAEDLRKDLPRWVAVWKNVRSQLMPPADQPQPHPEEREALLRWVEDRVFQLDRNHPDPGRVTARRLNRQEYRYTIQDMLGVDFRVEDAFPADDTGYGFDTIGDVLSLSPLQVEKYLEAARTIAGMAISTDPPKPPVLTLYGDHFRVAKADKGSAKSLSLHTPVIVERMQKIEHPGPYRWTFDWQRKGDTDGPDRLPSMIIVRVDDVEQSRQEVRAESPRDQQLSFELALTAGPHRCTIEIIPAEGMTPEKSPGDFSLRRADLTGPLDGSYVEYPASYRKIFIDGPPPSDPRARKEYASKILRSLADRAFRRPVDEETLSRLVAFAGSFDEGTDPMRFEKGIAEALAAILASPRFLFRTESQPNPDDKTTIVELDEYALASRMSYFLWSSLPDEELTRLAREGRLRAELKPQIDRMLADGKSQRMIRSFVGQWLQSRDVETINIDVRRVLKIKDLDEAFRTFNGNLRRAMREETEMLFAYLIRENRSVLDLLTADYSFLNESLARWYGIEGVQGNEMRKVDLPAESHRGGILTQASFLIVTSNPTRTSPVKRGLFVLDNILGTPAPAPPPNVPPLEAVKSEGKKLSMREMMVKHREDALCASCHARMDPLGLALEQYDAAGRYRTEEAGQPIETAGQLITGEKFNNVQELSQVIATTRRRDFYTCLTEKMLTYALGRGLEYYDAPAVETIVARLESDGGAMRSLIDGIITSTPFQRRRGDGGE